MKNLRFIVETEPDCHPLEANSYLYNSESYLRLKQKKFGLPISFYALAGKVAMARIHFFIELEHGQLGAVSLPESPFGSLEFNHELSAKVLQNFLEFIKITLAHREIKSICIKDCIPAYRFDIKFSLHEVFIRSGFTVEESLVNHHIEVDGTPLLHKMHRMEKKRLRKCMKANVIFKEEPLTSIEFFYQFLLMCRQEKGWHLSLSYAETIANLQGMPDAYRLFAAYLGDECIAASLSIIVNNHILYDFYHDASAAFKGWSPVVFLVDGIYQWCQKEKINIIDLGTSLTPSLQQFKNHLGGLPAHKPSYQIQL